MRVFFMGTPDFAAASLEKLISEQFEIVGVMTQPDRPRGRGMKETYSAVKEVAVAHDIPVFQPDKMRDGEAFKIISTLQPDVLAVVAFGRLLPDDILAIPQYGAVNVHGSILPKYRGSAPIQRAVINGDRETGVTTMYLASEMDTGDIIYSESTEIGEYETSGDLFERLKVMGAELLVRTLRDIEIGTAPRIPQNHSVASYAQMLDKNEAPINWSMPSRTVIKQIYGLQPWPVATAVIGGQVCKIFGARYSENKTSASAGQIVSAGNAGIEIACADGETIYITELQAPGKKRVSGADYVRGHKLL